MCCFGRKSSYDHPPPKPVMLPSSSEVEVENLSQSLDSLSIHQTQPTTTTRSMWSAQTSSPAPPTSPPSKKPSFYIDSPIPRFPLPSPPRCRHCNSIATRDIVNSSNRNNNAGRPYYKCLPCKQSPMANPQKGWITWDDDIGVHENNRTCICGLACRQGRAGSDSVWEGKGFWTCAVGRCSFISYRKDAYTMREAGQRGLEGWNEGFEPWLLG